MTSVIDLAHACLRCPGVRWLFVGDPDYFPALQKLICNPGDEFRFVLRSAYGILTWPAAVSGETTQEGRRYRLLRPIGVGLYAPETIRRHPFCTTDSLLSTDLGRPLNSAGACHTCRRPELRSWLA